MCLVLGIGPHTMRVVLKCAFVTVLMCVLLYVVVSVRVLVLEWLTSDSLCASVSLHWVPVSSQYSFEYSHQSFWASVCLSFTLLPRLLTSSVNVFVHLHVSVYLSVQCMWYLLTLLNVLWEAFVLFANWVKTPHTQHLGQFLSEFLSFSFLPPGKSSLSRQLCFETWESVCYSSLQQLMTI